MKLRARLLGIESGGKPVITLNREDAEELDALCVKQEVLSWRYPPSGGLERLIEQKGLYPITILKLSSLELASFAKIGFMIARHLLEANASEISSKTGISAERISRLQDLTRRILL
jgi:hypothetical protein